MTTPCIEDKTLFINEGREAHDFGVADPKGRAVGCRVAFCTKTFVAGTSPRGGWDFTGEPGTYFCWIGQATRAGEDFGASQSWTRCKTEAERFEQVAKYLKGAKARAVKSFG